MKKSKMYNFSFKCGLELVNTFKGARHPVIDLVINSLRIYAKHNGADGIKRIVLMLKYFLRSLFQEDMSKRRTSSG